MPNPPTCRENVARRCGLAAAGPGHPRAANLVPSDEPYGSKGVKPCESTTSLLRCASRDARGPRRLDDRTCGERSNDTRPHGDLRHHDELPDAVDYRNC